MTKQTMSSPQNPDDLLRKARALGLWGLVENWDEVSSKDWLEQVIAYEDEVRGRRSLERRIQNAKLGRFKPLCDFDWNWPEKIDRELVDEVYTLGFLKETAVDAAPGEEAGQQEDPRLRPCDPVSFLVATTWTGLPALSREFRNSLVNKKIALSWSPHRKKSVRCLRAGGHNRR